MVVTILATLLISISFVNAQEAEQQASPQSEQQMQSDQPAWEYCPYCGRHMGPGVGGPKMERQRGMEQQEGMERRMPFKSLETKGYQEGYGYYGPGCPGGAPAHPVNEQEARQMLQSYIGNNPNLRLGDFETREGGFQARIVTKEGNLVDEVFIDKNTGWMKSIY